MTETTASLDVLLNALLESTLQLQKRMQEEAEPEEWNELLDQRQNIIDQLSGLMEKGITLTNEQKRIYLQPAVDADQGINFIMTCKKKKLETDMANLQKSKVVNEQYGGYGSTPSAYGAFFDKRN